MIKLQLQGGTSQPVIIQAPLTATNTQQVVQVSSVGYTINSIKFTGLTEYLN